MKPCEQILLYAQGELNAEDKTAFETHLKTCGACQAELKFLAKLDEGLTPPAAPQRAVGVGGPYRGRVRCVCVDVFTRTPSV